MDIFINDKLYGDVIKQVHIKQYIGMIWKKVVKYNHLQWIYMKYIIIRGANNIKQQWRITNIQTNKIKSL